MNETNLTKKSEGWRGGVSTVFRETPWWTLIQSNANFIEYWGFRYSDHIYTFGRGTPETR